MFHIFHANSYVVILGLALSILLVSPQALATTCKCRQHPAQAEASGTCSRTEDKSSCTLTFTATTPEEYARFVRELRSYGLDEIDPHLALDFAMRSRPEEWKIQGLAKVLPVLFAISQREIFVDVTPKVFEAFKSNCTQDACSVFEHAFRLSGQTVEKDFGEFKASVSYGCIELQRGDLYTMVKTRWSPRRFFCDGD